LFSTDIAAVPDVPNATVTTKWQEYLWLRFITDGLSNVTGVALYIWNPAAALDATYLKMAK
jgi:hypothetical protein